MTLKSSREERLTLSEARARQSETGSPVSFPMEAEGMPAEAVSALPRPRPAEGNGPGSMTTSLLSVGFNPTRGLLTTPRAVQTSSRLLNDFDGYGDGPQGR